MILQNEIQCKKCGDSIYSAHRHDFKYCSCESVFIDGGMDYVRSGGELNLVEDKSIFMNDSLVAELREAIEEINREGSSLNSLGVLCLIMRTLRDNGYNANALKETNMTNEDMAEVAFRLFVCTLLLLTPFAFYFFVLL